MTEEERFENICKPWMARMERELTTSTTELVQLLKGKNGDPGLIDDVRHIKETRAKWEKLTWLVAAAAIGQFAVLIAGLF